MAQNERYEDRLDGPQKSISFAVQASLTSMPTTTEEEEIPEPDEPPEISNKFRINTNFHRSTINNNRKESLLTRALMCCPDSDIFYPLVLDIERRRSYTSTISSMELTSDGGLTSPSTPSPPLPSTVTQHMTSFNLGPKAHPQPLRPLVKQNNQDLKVTQPAAPNTIKAEPMAGMLTKKRHITFACGGQKPISQPQPPPKTSKMAVPLEERTGSTALDNSTVPLKRACAIKFACPATVRQGIQVAKPTEVARRQNSRSPTMSRKPRPTSSPRSSHKTSASLSRRTSRSPFASRRRRPTFLTSNQSVQSSEATRFHEFASEVVEEDDWIRRDSCEDKKKLTINDTLKKENVIRQLGKEAEEEALQEEEDERDEDNHQDSEDEEQEDNSDSGSDVDETDGNETDNEAGFAESDEETEDEEFQFWTPGKPGILNTAAEASTYRASVHRTTSESSIDSPRCMSPPMPWSEANSQRTKANFLRQPKIRPGTPDLPDSTDFVCGTLDEDRPLEEAYLSCMEVRKREKHRAIPQDIDPSFPTSDPENDEEEDEDRAQNDSDEPVWMHGKFEESDDHDRAHRRSRARKSPHHSPKRMHSPPPLKSRLRSPAPRRLFGGASPRRMRSPIVMRDTGSPRASPTSRTTSNAITFTPLGERPGLTHTKSLPRTPNAFCKQYRALRLAAANADLEDETSDGYARGAIDIVKGLERRRQHRKGSRKGVPERKPQPGQGAERMRELALHMAGKTCKAQYVLSV